MKFASRLKLSNLATHNTQGSHLLLQYGASYDDNSFCKRFVLKQRMKVPVIHSLFFFFLFFIFDTASAASFVETISRIKPSIVAIGTFQKTRNPQYVFKGTGFVVGNGKQIITNNHVVPTQLDYEHNETLAVFTGKGKQVQAISADLVKKDATHDLALLEIQQKLPILSLSTNSSLPDGSEIAFTGFPIGMILGIYPVTHQGIISATVPLAIPPANQRNLTTSMIRALRDAFSVYQLDAVAYPGNSGSPVYDKKTGEVIAVVNSVFVKGKKETALSEPTGITYAIPVKYVRQLLSR